MCDENLLKFWKLVGFQKFWSKMCWQFSQKTYYLLFFLLKTLNLKLVENLVEFSLENFDILIKIRVSQDDLVLSFEKLIKTLLGFLMKILANFLKACLFFWKFLNLKFVEEFSFENFDILTKICICENMWGIFEMIMSFGNLIKTLLGFAENELWIFRKSCWTFWELLLWLSKKTFVNLRAWDARDSLVKSCVL